MGMIEVLRRVSADKLEEIVKTEDFFLNLEPNWRKTTDSCIDIDKSWDAICYLLAGGYLAHLAIHGDTPIKSIEAQFGSVAHYLKPEQVVEVNEFLSNITIDDIRECYDPESLDKADIYPGIWLRDKQEGLEYILHFFVQLKKLYKDAAKAGECVLMLVF